MLNEVCCTLIGTNVVDPWDRIKQKEIHMRRLLVSLLPLALPAALMAYLHLQNAFYERREELAREATERRSLQYRHL
jgi:hypothetical protein